MLHNVEETLELLTYVEGIPAGGRRVAAPLSADEKEDGAICLIPVGVVVEIALIEGTGISRGGEMVN